MLSTHGLAFGAALGLFFAVSLTFGSSKGTAPAHDTTPVAVVSSGNIAKGIEHPLHGDIRCSGQGSQCSGSMQLSNQRAIIEFVSGMCTINPGLALRFVKISTVAGSGSSQVQPIPLVDHVGTSDGVSRFITFGSPVRIYADANSLIQADATADGSVQATAPVDCEVEISGQLINAP